MGEVTINLTGAASYYTEWKREFMTDLEMSFPGRVVDHDKEIQVVAGRHSSQINVDRTQDDINVRVDSMYSDGGGGGGFIGFCLLLMAIMFLFSAWRFAFMPFYFVSPVWIIIFFVIIASPGGRHGHYTLIGPISRMARSSWERVMLRKKQSSEASTTSNKSEEVYQPRMPSPGPKLEVTPDIPMKTVEVPPENLMKKAIDNGRPPDEEYLLSPAAAEAARTSALVTNVDEDMKPKEGIAAFCPHCGARRQLEAKFCWNCGSNLVSQETKS